MNNLRKQNDHDHEQVGNGGAARDGNAGQWFSAGWEQWRMYLSHKRSQCKGVTSPSRHMEGAKDTPLRCRRKRAFRSRSHRHVDGGTKACKDERLHGIRMPAMKMVSMVLSVCVVEVQSPILPVTRQKWASAIATEGTSQWQPGPTAEKAACRHISWR